jgi:hypothetical protein
MNSTSRARCLSVVFALALPTSAIACGQETVAFSHDNLQGPLGTSLDDCPLLPADTTLTLDGTIVIRRVCILDDHGTYYASGLTDSDPPPPGLAVVPGGHAYAIVYEFDGAWVPTASAATAGSKAYAGPDNVYAGMLPEGIPGQKLTTTSVTVAGTVMTQKLGAVLPDGDQVASTLDLSALFPTHPELALDGFAMRFYIGHPPQGPTTPCAVTSTGGAEGNSTAMPCVSGN